MLAVVFVLVFLTVIFAGLLAMALAIDVIHGDDSATYKLFAIRDRVMGSVVFEGVERHNPWVDWMYGGLTMLLACSHVFCGPRRWSLASMIGAKLGTMGDQRGAFPPPNTPVPEKLLPVLKDFQAALEHLMRHHIGWKVLLSSRLKAQRKEQRKRAEEMLGAMAKNARVAT